MATRSRRWAWTRPWRSAAVMRGFAGCRSASPIRQPWPPWNSRTRFPTTSAAAAAARPRAGRCRCPVGRWSTSPARRPSHWRPRSLRCGRRSNTPRGPPRNSGSRNWTPRWPAGCRSRPARRRSMPTPSCSSGSPTRRGLRIGILSPCCSPRWPTNRRGSRCGLRASRPPSHRRLSCLSRARSQTITGWPPRRSASWRVRSLATCRSPGWRAGWRWSNSPPSDPNSCGWPNSAWPSARGWR